MSQSLRDPPERTALKETLLRHGFETAAKYLSDRDFIPYGKALASWKDYPDCMEAYPKVINRPPWK